MTMTTTIMTMITRIMMITTMTMTTPMVIIIMKRTWQVPMAGA